MHKTSSTTPSAMSEVAPPNRGASAKRTESADGESLHDILLDAEDERERHFVSINGKPLDLPVMTIAEFCRRYNLSENIRQRLEEEEFNSAGAVLEVSEGTLQTAGFKSGQIADLKRALKEFLITNLPPAPGRTT
ncbi:hypothetical protein K438DRAFT_1937020 [Mycena galopus ATCC 62051]|nr:hypothetical protein K438DRAFT_1937020 [Mycena galopus ATCC 62051]